MHIEIIPKGELYLGGLGIFTGQGKEFLLEKANVNAVEFYGYFSVRSMASAISFMMRMGAVAQGWQRLVFHF